MKILLAIIIAFSMFMLWKIGIQDYDTSRETFVSKLVDKIQSNRKYNFKSKDFSVAEQLCLSWVGEKEKVNCSSGRELQVKNFNRSIRSFR